MDPLAKFNAEITALTEEAALALQNWRENENVKKYPSLAVDLTTVQVLGQISPSTYAVKLLSRKYFAREDDILKQCLDLDAALASRAVATRKVESLRQQHKLLDDLFKFLVEQEVPEANEYYAWEVHPAGHVFVRLNAIHKDTKFINYFSGNTQDTALDL